MAECNILGGNDIDIDKGSLGWLTGMGDDDDDEKAINTVKQKAQEDNAKYKGETSDWTHIGEDKSNPLSVKNIYQYEVYYEEYTITITKKSWSTRSDLWGTKMHAEYDCVSNVQSETVGVVEFNKGRISNDPSKVLYFINYARLFLNVKSDSDYIPMSIGYLIIYIALVVMTGVFAIRYIKRVIYIAFLTLIAPMVALTYPLDKIKDRKSTSMEYVV